MGTEFQKATFRKTSVKLAVFRSLSQSLEKCKNTKSGLVPMSKQEKVTDLFLRVSVRLKT